MPWQIIFPLHKGSPVHRTVFAEGIVYSLVTLPFLQTLVGLKCARTYIYMHIDIPVAGASQAFRPDP